MADDPYITGPKSKKERRKEHQKTLDEKRKEQEEREASMGNRIKSFFSSMTTVEKINEATEKMNSATKKRKK